MFLKYSMPVGALVCAAALWAGCGSDLKLKVNTADEVRHTPAADLTRKVEISYHDSDGSEKYREVVPVTGLGQPIDFNADSLKDVDWNKDGHWEARALDDAGGLLLYGSSQADPDKTDTVEISISRAAAVAAKSGASDPAASVLLKAVRAVGFGSGEKIEAADLRAKQIQGQCIQLQKLSLKLDAAGESFEPALVFETSVRGGAVSYSFSKDGPRSNVLLGVFGESVLELGAMVRERMKSKSSGSFELYFFTAEYEGCASVSYEAASLMEPILSFEKGPFSGRVDPSNPANFGMAGYVYLQNPNPFPVSSEISCFLDDASGAAALFTGPSGHTNYSVLRSCSFHAARQTFVQGDSIGAGNRTQMTVCGYMKSSVDWQSTPPQGYSSGFRITCRASITNDAGVHAEAPEKSFSF